MKLMLNNYMSTNSVREALGKEYDILSSLKYHPNIIQLYKHFIDEPTDEILNYLPTDIAEQVIEINHRTKEKMVKKTMIIILDYYEQSLESFLKNSNNVPIEKLLAICEGIGEGLNFLFQNKVIHRDIKLENILIDNHDCPIICDFGMSSFVDESGMGLVREPGGNQSHLAPEILNSFSHSGGEKSICYLKQPSFEFGVICFEILCGYYPFENYPGFLKDEIKVDSVESKFEKFKDIPTSVINSIIQLLSNDPDERPLIEDIIDYFNNLN